MVSDAPATSAAPSAATDAVLRPSEPVPTGATPVQGVDFNHHAHRPVTVAELVDSMASTGFQATAVADAVRIINDMVRALCYPASVVER